MGTHAAREAPEPVPSSRASGCRSLKELATMSSIVIAKFWPVIVGLGGILSALLLGWIKTKHPSTRRP